MRQQRGEIKLRQETKIKRVQVNVNHIERKKNKKKKNKTREKKQKLRNRKFFILMLTSGVISLNGRG